MIFQQASLTYNISARAPKYQRDNNDPQSKPDRIIADPAKKKITRAVESKQNK
jgi:hypothetical protein